MRENKIIDYDKFVISKKGQPGLGYYWTLNKKKFKKLNLKIQNELNAMIRTNTGINNYKVGDKIGKKAEIKKISIRDQEIIISNGMKNYSYKLNK